MLSDSVDLVAESTRTPSNKSSALLTEARHCITRDWPEQSSETRRTPSNKRLFTGEGELLKTYQHVRPMKGSLEKHYNASSQEKAMSKTYCPHWNKIVQSKSPNDSHSTAGLFSLRETLVSSETTLIANNRYAANFVHRNATCSKKTKKQRASSTLHCK